MQENKPHIWLDPDPNTTNELKILVQCPSSKGLNLTPSSNISSRRLTLKFDLTSITPGGQLMDFDFNLESVTNFSRANVDLVTVQVMLGSTVKGSASATTASAYFY
jgi:hypothetical protein